MDWSSRIGRRLKLRDLHILFAVVQSGNMTKAARALSVSNPVVSKAIADLEHTLGVRVLDRTPQGVEPTIYGRALARPWPRGVRRVAPGREGYRFPRRSDDRRSAHRGVDRGGDDVRCGRRRPVSSRRHPRIVIHLIAGEPSATFRALEDRRVDLGIVRLYAPVSEGHMDAEILYEEPWVVVDQRAAIRGRGGARSRSLN